MITNENNAKRKDNKLYEAIRFLTSYEAYTELGITQFATRISELEDRGYKFKKEWTSRKNQNGETKYFKKYYLEEK